MTTNKLSRLPLISFIAIGILSFSQAGFAGWTLNQDASSLYYITSKAAAVSELNSFAELAGTIDDQGNASISISLSSVDTAIDIRNERMRDIVFQVTNYPLARVSIKADGPMLAAMSPGDNFQASYEAVIDLHGMQQGLNAQVVVNKLKEGGLLVSLTRPLIVNAASFGLAESVEQLREIAGLPSINNNVVVDFTLQFDETD